MKINNLAGLIGLPLLTALYMPQGQAQVPVPASALLQRANIPQSSLSVLAIRLKDGQQLLSHQPHQPLQPASTLKVLTAIAALDMLGPTHVGKAELRTSATVENGVLKGDLVLRGEASPDFTWDQLRDLLQTLRHAGIEEIGGDVVVDRHYFRPARLDVGLPPFDDTPEFRYNVIPDALLLNTNLIKVQMDASGTALRVNFSPELENVRLTTNMRLITRECAKWEDGWKLPVTTRHADGRIDVLIHGDFPMNCSATTQISVVEREEYADRVFRSLWKSIGGRFAGKVREAEAPTNATRVLATHRSRTLAEFTRDINKRSDNPITRLTFLTMGATSPDAKQRSELTTTQLADLRVRQWLKQKGINDTGLVLDNGSGLSRDERISVAQLVAVLRVAHASEWAPEFMTALPIVAVDGGMRNRLRGTTAEKRARLKTGTLRNTWALAGYAPDGNGDLCAVAVILNDDRTTGAVARPILDAVIAALTQSKVEKIDSDWPDPLTRMPVS